MKRIFKNEYVYLIAILFGLTTSCGDRSENFKSYYFQLEDFVDAKCYAFVNEEDSLKNEFWEIRAIGKKLRTKAFDCNFEQYELFEEYFKEDGSELVRYQIIHNGEIIETHIIESDVFKWFTKELYTYTISCNVQGNLVELSKKRKIIGFDEITILGKKRNVIALEGTYTMKDANGNIDLLFEQKSFYCEKLGFVGYDRYYSDGKKSKLRLGKILSIQEWNQIRNHRVIKESS